MPSKDRAASAGALVVAVPPVGWPLGAGELAPAAVPPVAALVAAVAGAWEESVSVPLEPHPLRARAATPRAVIATSPRRPAVSRCAVGWCCWVIVVISSSDVRSAARPGAGGPASPGGGMTPSIVSETTADQGWGGADVGARGPPVVARQGGAAGRDG